MSGGHELLNDNVWIYCVGSGFLCFRDTSSHQAFSFLNHLPSKPEHSCSHSWLQATPMHKVAIWKRILPDLIRSIELHTNNKWVRPSLRIWRGSLALTGFYADYLDLRTFPQNNA